MFVFPRFADTFTGLTKLSQYDLVLSISEKTINSQWLHLYRTSVGDATDKKFLIPHELEIVDPDEPSTYIKGVVHSPTVSFSDISSGAIPHRTVRMNFKFTDKKDKSFFATSVVHTDPKTHKQSIVEVKEDIKGWTFSFEAGVGRKDIQKILEDGLTTEATAALKPHVPTDAVPSVDFLASSIYCLFESSQIIKTVRLLDAQGKEPASLQKTVFVAALVNHFTALNGDAAIAGKHPHVFGYAIHQQPNRHVDKAAMVPTVFQMSTTADQTEFSTLNFLMLEHGDPIDDPNAGLFPKPLFSKLCQTIHNGVLAMSAEAFTKEFLLPVVVPHFRQKPPTDKEIEIMLSLGLTASPEKIIWNDLWKAKTTKDADAVAYWRKWDFEGTTENTITYTSLAQSDPAAAAKSDSKHSLKLTVKQRHAMHSLVETAPRGPLSDTWSYAFETDMTVEVETVYWITPGEDGQFIATYDEAASRFPPRDASGLKTRLVTLGYDPTPHADSIPVKVQYHGIFSFGDIVNLFASSILPGFSSGISKLIAGNYDLKTFQDQGSQLSDVRDKIIMPAGDILTYAGLDSDADGHVYTAIDYRTLTDGTVQPDEA